MRTLILSAILSSLLVIRAAAQDTKNVIDKLVVIKTELRDILHKQLSDTCRKPVSKYNNDISKIITSTITPATATQLLSINKKFADTCHDSSIKKLDSSIKALSAALRVYLKPKSDNGQSSNPAPPVKTATSKPKPDTNFKTRSAGKISDTIQLKFKVYNGHDSKLLIKSLNGDTALSFLKVKRDSAGYLVFLFGHRKKPTTVIAKIPDKHLPGAKPETNSSIGDFIQMYRWLWGGIFALFLLCLFIIVYQVYSLNKIKRAIPVVPAAEPIKTDPPVSQPQISQPEIQTTTVTDLAPISNSQKLVSMMSRYFDCEILMTAGPRKKDDIDLGEDVSGFKIKGGEALFWLMDGSSDYDHIPRSQIEKDYFSSRLLAQSIAINLKQQFDSGSSPDKIVLDILENVKTQWLTDLNALTADEKEIFRTNIRETKSLLCATTILFGKLNIDGQLTAYRSGDSRMFIYTSEKQHLKLLSSELATKNSASEEKIFFRLIVEDGEFKIQYNQPVFETTRQTGVQVIIIGSDGVGGITTQMLTQDNPGDIETVRTEITRQIQGTIDDKSLCIIEIKENRGSI